MTKYCGVTNAEISNREIEHEKVIRKLAGECMVLLENDGTLPILKGEKKLALYGNGARRTVKGGTGSGDVNSRRVINIEQGLEAAGFEITTKAWLDNYDKLLDKEHERYIAKLEAISKEKGTSTFIAAFDNPFKEPFPNLISKEDIHNSKTATAIYVIARNSGEGADRYNTEGDYLLAKEEINNITLLAKEYEKFILVLNVGGIIDTTAIKSINGINAIILAGQTGSIGGHAVADVLTGDTVPSGKLADTWAKDYEDYPSAKTYSHNNGNTDDEYYTEGIYVGYRYFDTFNISPNYCFGYGLSYTSFDIKVCEVMANENQVSVIVKVKNIGEKYSGKEVVQIYYSAPEGNIDKPYQELAAFGKTKILAPAEEEQLKISFKITSMASYSEEEAAWIIEKGSYIIRVGNSSRNTKVAAVIQLDKDAVTERLKNTFKDSEKLELISNISNKVYKYKEEPTEIVKAKKINIDASKINAIEIKYKSKIEKLHNNISDKKLTMEDVLEKRAKIEDLISQLTVEEMAALCVGTMRINANADDIIGSSSISVPGAAGDTTSLMNDDRKIGNLIMADGPAGLRLTPHFQTTLDGEIIPTKHAIPGFIGGEEIKSPDTIDYYQYCTAIPIAWMLSQSWDMKLIEDIGKIVGKEMLEFNVSLWLAPGMNIHRNPLCGRNFEYYSEDPLLTGMCAAADTRGIQSFPGIGTTIKHFAANSQEDNRMFNNAHISERALREIYLKGFEIAVKSSQPMSIMTSYNLINGIHSANNYDLLTLVLRDEWGFEGFVMTDWFSSQDVTLLFGDSKHKYPIASSKLCIKAGNELQMPGSKENVDDIVAAVKEGVILLEELQNCSKNILKVISKSNYYDGVEPYTEQFDNLNWYFKVENE